MQDLLRVCTSYMGRTSPRVCALVQLLELGSSVLGFPLRFFGRLGGLRYRDVVPLAFFQRVTTATPGSGSKGMGACQLVMVHQSKQFKKVTY